MRPYTRPARAAALAAAAVLAASTHAAYAGAADDLVRDSRGIPTIRSFKLRQDVVNPQGEHVRELTYVAPDRLRIDTPDNGSSVVVIGRYAWIRGVGKDHGWSKLSIAPGQDPLAAVHDQNAIAKSVSRERVSFVGTQQLDGQAMHVYDVSPPPKPGYQTSSSRIWIGTHDGYPHKIVAHNGPYEATSTYSNFNQPLAVSGP